jgi:Protein kinase domain
MAATAPAEQVGNYLVEEELGRGAHGVVYRAHHRDRPNRTVALKVVPNRGDLDRLLLEPALLSTLDHPGIVGIEDYFVRGDDLVLALEFIEGDDLKSLLERGDTFDQAEVRELLAQLASALAEAHSRNVIHRDIKPGNVLVQRDGGRLRFVLTDFGIGRKAEGIQVKKHTGGTFSFMAPEQLRGRPCPQSDLWALGVVAYRLLTGRMPFPGPTLGELSHQILYAAPLPPSECCPGPVDPQLETVVLRLLDKSLQERVASAEELLELLGQHGQGTVAGPGKRHAPAAAGLSLERRLARGIAVRRVLIVVCVLLYLLPGGLLSGVLLLAGMVLFYRAQKDERWGRPVAALATLAAIVVLACFVVLRYGFSRWDLSVPNLLLVNPGLRDSLVKEFLDFLGPLLGGVTMTVVGILVVVLYVLYLFLPVMAGALYATMRRLQREQVLRDAALADGTGSDRYLQALRDALDSRFEDVGLHLKYAEALFARGRVKEAAVEARLLLRQDPYHFNGNLLLANAYHALGLPEDCVAVCDAYLAVSGYCFEFSELREQCQRRLGRP